LLELPRVKHFCFGLFLYNSTGYLSIWKERSSKQLRRKRILLEPYTATYLFIGKKGYEAIENVRTRSEAVQNV